MLTSPWISHSSSASSSKSNLKYTCRMLYIIACIAMHVAIVNDSMEILILSFPCHVPWHVLESNNDSSIVSLAYFSLTQPERTWDVCVCLSIDWVRYATERKLQNQFSKVTWFSSEEGVCVKRTTMSGKSLGINIEERGVQNVECQTA